MKCGDPLSEYFNRAEMRWVKGCRNPAGCVGCGHAVRELAAAPVPEKRERAPFVIGDTIDPVRCHADGKMYDSKRAMARETRARGYECLGNEMPKDHVPDTKAQGKRIEAEIRKSLEIHGGYRS